MTNSILYYKPCVYSICSYSILYSMFLSQKNLNLVPIDYKALYL